MNWEELVYIVSTREKEGVMFCSPGSMDQSWQSVGPSDFPDPESTRISCCRFDGIISDSV